MEREPLGASIPCRWLEPGSVSRDRGRFQLRCLYKHAVTAEKHPGCSDGGREGKRRKPKKPLASSAPAAVIHVTLCTWGCLDETEPSL